MFYDTVFFEQRDIYTYPPKDYSFSPSVKYPEYQYESISPVDNPVYDMVRSCLYGMGLDAVHYGLAEWNPLADIIHKGDVVLIKPNLVRHENQVIKNGTECLITHPSIVRAVADFALLALHGTGKLIIGDAPVQDCDFTQILNDLGYKEIQEFYARQKREIPILDFRLVASQIDDEGILVSRKQGDSNDYAVVNLGAQSAFFELSNSRQEKLRITNYDPAEMRKHHKGNFQQYVIPLAVLEADVVVNLPKPKTHRKAGMTGALKNLVGINGHKDWLPHHTKGAVADGGDEYLCPSVFKRLKTNLSEKIDVANLNQQRRRSKLYRNIRFIIHQLEKPFVNDHFCEGSWYGNDTIWRMIYDLNRILLFADKDGNVTNEPQRRQFILADMIISGEGEGPLLPEAKKVGIIAAGHEAILFDKAIAVLMGFDYNKIPSIRNMDFTNKLKMNEDFPKIISNDSQWNCISAETLEQKLGLGFKPSAGWIGHIERGGGGQK